VNQTICPHDDAWSISRRDWIRGAAALAAAGMAPVRGQNAAIHVYSGTYTGRGRGIYHYTMDAATGKLTLVNVAQGEMNPSFLALDPQRRFLYAVNEIGNYQGRLSGSVAAFAINPADGELTFLNRQPSEGRTTAHISVDPTNRFVMVANYTGGAGGGNVCILPINRDGSLGDPSQVVDHLGEPGPNRGPQTQARAHMILPDAAGRFVLANDLGLDKTFIYALDREAGKLVAAEPPFAVLAPGAGPRHLAFHPNGRIVYVINELNSTMTVFDYDAQSGAMAEKQTLSTLPDNWVGINSTAHVVVAPSGRFVYGSNRGHDSIAIFSVDSATSRLTLIGHQDTVGRTPRNFGLDPSGNWMYVGNQDTDNFVTFRVNPATGGLTNTGMFTAQAQPVCFVFSPPQPVGNSAKTGVTFWANPDIIYPPDAIPLGETTLAWNAPDASELEIRVGAPNGPSMGSQAKYGTTRTGRWVREGMTFFLQDVSGGKPLTADNTLATVRLAVR